jgi:flagellar protein FlbT
MPLKLSLKPGEKFVLNGAVVQNGDRRSVLVLQNKARRGGSISRS